MSYLILPALLLLGVNAALQAMGKSALIQRALGERYANPWLRLPLVAFYVGLLVLVTSEGFQSWPWTATR